MSWLVIYIIMKLIAVKVRKIMVWLLNRSGYVLLKLIQMLIMNLLQFCKKINNISLKRISIINQPRIKTNF